jgi:hypothetical protein
MDLKSLIGSTAKLWVIDQAQLSTYKIRLKPEEILIKNGCVDWSPAHFCGNHIIGQGTKINRRSVQVFKILNGTFKTNNVK